MVPPHIAYVDTSVLLATFGEEEFTAWALDLLPHYQQLSSAITEVELTRYAHRRGMELRHVDEVARRLSLISVNDWVISQAKLLAGEVTTVDAIQIASWLQVLSSGLDCPFITADKQQAVAAARVGALVLHPFQ